jgi:polygalacturonase
MRHEHSRREVLKLGGLAVGGALAWSAVPVRPAAASGQGAGVLDDPGPWDQVPDILARIRPPSFPGQTFPITRYGAVADGQTDCTEAFRRAIAECHDAGGGRVLVPEGVFLTGAIHLRSNVELQVIRDGTIRFSTDPAAYLPVVFTRFEGTECYNYSPFIYAYGQRNVAVTGAGTLDGQASLGEWESWYANGGRSETISARCARWGGTGCRSNSGSSALGISCDPT